MKRVVLWLLTLALLCTALPALAADYTFAFDRSVTTLYAGETLQTILNRSGDPATGIITYVSSAEKNATVDATGLVTGLKRGQTTITATLKTASRSYRATITLTVAQRVESISVNEDRLSVFAPEDPAIASLLASPVTSPVLMLPVGTSTTLKISAEPTNANDRTCTVSTSDAAVCKVSRATLTSVAPGECDVTIASRQDPSVTRSYHIIVVQPIKKVELSAFSSTLFVGGSLQLTPAISPENATFPAVTWSSSNEEIAAVSSSGLVTGVKKGTVTMKATAADGSGRSGTIRLTVAQQPTGITLSESALTLNIGTSKRLTAEVQPSNANDRSVTWTSSDETVATVNAYGTIKPLKPGQCTITATSKALLSVKSSCVVTVHRLAEKVTFTAKSTSVSVGSTGQVFWSVSPADTTNTAVTLTSSNEKIATVDQNGVITPVKRGSCTITATANDGSRRKGSIKVEVLQPVYGVHMSSDLYHVGVDESETLRAVLEPSDASNTHMTWTSADASIATVRGSNTRPKVTGHRWGTVVISGTTEDGGFTTSTSVKVGNYDRALRINDLYLSDNKIKISVENVSNMNITRFYYAITCYDMFGQPIPVTTSGSNILYGSYDHTLYEGDSTTHGRFTFEGYVQPTAIIGHIELVLTEYHTDEGFSRYITEGNEPSKTFELPGYAPLAT